jgi:hypothetical protein
MKSGREHRVPLSPAAVSLLEALPRFDGVELIFPGRATDKPLSDMSLTAVMRRMKLTAVPHGLRSTFSDWCAERTSTPAEVREMALAHARRRIGGATCLTSAGRSWPNGPPSCNRSQPNLTFGYGRAPAAMRVTEGGLR